jgi:hypothetical protein
MPRAGSATATAGRALGGAAGWTRSVRASVARAAGRRSRGSRRPSERSQAGEPEQDQQAEARRALDRGVANQIDAGINAVGRGQTKRSAPAARKARNGGAAGEPERGAEQERPECRKQEPPPGPARRNEAKHADTGQRDDRHEQGRADSEQEQQAVAEIGSERAGPVGRRAAGGGGQRGIGRVMGRERHRRDQGEAEQGGAAKPHEKAPRRFAQHIAPVGRQLPLRYSRGNTRHPIPQIRRSR